MISLARAIKRMSITLYKIYVRARSTPQLSPTHPPTTHSVTQNRSACNIIHDSKSTNNYLCVCVNFQAHIGFLSCDKCGPHLFSRALLDAVK